MTFKANYYVIRSDGELGATGTPLTVIGNYRWMAGAMTLLGFFLGVAVTLAIHV